MFDACALIAVVIPTTCPRLLISGPPLLPKLMAASVWMNASRLGSNSFRPRKLTTPTVTECTYPSGLPMAQTHSPTRSVSESPSGATGTEPVTGIRSNATSMAGSMPTSSALNTRPSPRVTVIRSAPSTT